MHHLAHRRSGQARRQLFQGKSPQDYAHLLNAGSQKLPKLLLIFGRYLHLKGGVATCPSMGPMIPQKQYIKESFHAVKGLGAIRPLACVKTVRFWNKKLTCPVRSFYGQVGPN